MKNPFSGKKSSVDDEVVDTEYIDATTDETFDDIEAADGNEQVRGTGGAGAVKRLVRNLRGKRRDGVAKNAKGRKLRPEERLASVVSESEPGAALGVLAENPNFVIPLPGRADGDAYALLLLPTQDQSFGGLGRKQSSNEAKGMLINQVGNDNIHAVVTGDLLDEDILAIIPDTESMEHMDEFSIMRKARYLFGVICVDPATGALITFSVPPRREKDVGGFLYDCVSDVLDGSLKLSEVIDLNLVAAMLRIIDQGADRDDIDAAMEVNSEVLVQALNNGDPYPVGEDYLAAQLMMFPWLATEEHDGTTFGAIAGVDVGEDDETVVENYIDSLDDAELAHVEAAEDVEVADKVEIIDENADGTVMTALPDDASNGTSRRGSSVLGGDEPPSFGSASAGQPPASVSAAPQAVNAVSRDEFESVLRDMLTENVERTSAATSEQMENTLAAFMSTLREQNPSLFGDADDREFSEEDVEVELRHRTRGAELDLGVNLDMLDKNLAHLPYQLPTPPLESTTPWLADQIHELVGRLNGNLEQMYRRNYLELRNNYISMCERAIDEIADELDVDVASTPSGKAFKALGHDREEMLNQSHNLADQKRAEIKAAWDEDRARYVEKAQIDAADEWDRRNGARRKNELARVDDMISTEIDRRIEAKRSEINASRRREAAKMKDIYESTIIEGLRDMAREQEAAEFAELEKAEQIVVSFLEEHRADSIRMADIEAQRLAADDRVERLSSEHQAQIEAMRADKLAREDAHQAALESVHAEADERIKSYVARMNDAEDAAKKRVEEAESQIKAMRERFEADKAETEQFAQSQVARANDSAVQAQRERDEILRKSTVEYKTLMVIVGLAMIVLLIAGVAAGAVFF